MPYYSIKGGITVYSLLCDLSVMCRNIVTQSHITTKHRGSIIGCEKANEEKNAEKTGSNMLRIEVTLTRYAIILFQ